MEFGHSAILLQIATLLRRDYRFTGGLFYKVKYTILSLRLTNHVFPNTNKNPLFWQVVIFARGSADSLSPGSALFRRLPFCASGEYPTSLLPGMKLDYPAMHILQVLQKRIRTCSPSGFPKKWN
jgi:hypothetical protein